MGFNSGFKGLIFLESVYEECLVLLYVRDNFIVIFLGNRD